MIRTKCLQSALKELKQSIVAQYRRLATLNPDMVGAPGQAGAFSCIHPAVAAANKEEPDCHVSAPEVVLKDGSMTFRRGSPNPNQPVVQTRDLFPLTNRASDWSPGAQTSYFPARPQTRPT
jgi:hypothetical protein